MKYTALMLLVALSLGAATEEIAGTWKTVMVDPPPGSPKLPLLQYEPVFEFKVDENKLTGKARMEEWPGNAPILDGTVNGNRITFRLIHERSYTTSSTGTHFPEFKCEGTIRGNELRLSMTGVDEARKYEMKGTKLSQ